MWSCTIKLKETFSRGEEGFQPHLTKVPFRSSGSDRSLDSVSLAVSLVLFAGRSSTRGATGSCLQGPDVR